MQVDAAVPGEGEIAGVVVEGSKVAVAMVDGKLYAFDDECTHRQCSLSEGELEGTLIICPCHMGTFDITTGAVVSGPPPAPVRTRQVRVVDGRLDLEA